ncbi:hypothetical protein IPG36_07975 [bacterium]|nr:MAG: hypothetical protein IPG36_07975 [bacterium]
MPLSQLVNWLGLGDVTEDGLPWAWQDDHWGDDAPNAQRRQRHTFKRRTRLYPIVAGLAAGVTGYTVLGWRSKG